MSIAIVEATRNFIVGPHREVAIKRGSRRVVYLRGASRFVTVTEDGSFFGWCNVDDGWRVIENKGA